MRAVIGIKHQVLTWVWTGAPVWMGAARLWNARRYGRRHCFVAGPAFLPLAIPVLLLGYGIIGLGPNGWRWLRLGVASGVVGPTVFSESSGKHS